MRRTVALTKIDIFLRKISRTIEAKTPTAPASVFLLSAVFILAVALKMEVNK